MNTFRLLFTTVFLGLGCGGHFSSTANAATTGFEISSWTVAGGGGVSSGGGFEVTGTIGQPVTAPRLTGGCWSVDPGFWSAYAVVGTPGAPVLSIRLHSFNLARVSFHPGCGDWVLQYATELGEPPTPTLWTDDAASNLVADGEDLVRDFHIPSWGPRLFFRLRRP